jgi:hypothetical protein
MTSCDEHGNESTGRMKDKEFFRVAGGLLASQMVSIISHVFLGDPYP